MGNMILEVAEMDTPIGELRVIQSSRGVCALAFVDSFELPAKQLRRRFGSVSFQKGPDSHGIVSRLAAYLDGDVAPLRGVPVDIEGTPFQLEVWKALRQIPDGETRSYKAVAEEIGRPRAVRAVGAAIGRNPAWIVVPCHRVVGSDGSLTGYAGGLDRKQWLLDHERRWTR